MTLADFRRAVPLAHRVLLLTLTMSTVGCSTEAAPGVQKRLAESIAMLEERIRALRVGDERHPIAESYYSAVLTDLKASTIESLAEPHVSYAGILKGTEDYVLRVYWIENQPSATAIRIVFDDGTTNITRVIHEDDHRSNQQEAERVVVYHASVRFSKESPDVELFKDDPKAIVQLLRNGAAVSNAIDISYAIPAGK